MVYCHVCYFSFAPEKINYETNITINGKVLECKQSTKYLGVIIDSNLSWKHIHKISKKVARGIGILSKVRHYLNINILIQLYYSLIYPYLTYGLVVWANTYMTTLQPITVLQKRAIRTITFSKFDEHTSPFI